jgi:hypothetical protein
MQSILTWIVHLQEKALAEAESRPLPPSHTSNDVRALRMSDFIHAHEQVWSMSKEFCMVRLFWYNPVYNHIKGFSAFPLKISAFIRKKYSAYDLDKKVFSSFLDTYLKFETLLCWHYAVLSGRFAWVFPQIPVIWTSLFSGMISMETVGQGRKH